VRTAKSVNVLAARSRSEWTASLRMPRLPVKEPDDKLPDNDRRADKDRDERNALTAGDQELHGDYCRRAPYFSSAAVA